MTSRHVIRKDGWLYWLAYFYRKEKDRPTGTVNLCDTVWLAIRTILAGIFLLAILTMATGVILFAGWHLLVGLWFVILSIVEWLAHPNLPTVSKDTFRLSLIVAGLWIFAFAGAATIIWGVPTFAKSETWRLFRAYLRAKKEKVCPIYEVV